MKNNCKNRLTFGSVNLDFGSELNFINMNNTKLENGDDFLKKEEYSLLTNLINILVGILLIIAILLMIIIPDNSDLPTLFALLAFTISSIPGILKKKVSGWVLGILGLIFIILFLI